MTTMTAITMDFIGYELDPGIYGFSIRKNAHETADIPGAEVSLTLKENVQYPTDPYTGAVVSNKMTGKKRRRRRRDRRHRQRTGY